MANQIKFAVRGKLQNAMRAANKQIDFKEINILTASFAAKTSSLTTAQAANILTLIECHADAIFKYFDGQKDGFKKIVTEIKTVNGYFRFPSPAYHALVYNFFDRNEELIKKIITLANWKPVTTTADTVQSAVLAAVQDLKTKIAIKSKKSIICVSTMQTFPSIKAAALALKIDASNISKVLNGKRKSAGKMIFSFN
jgi:hypothetical protein